MKIHKTLRIDESLLKSLTEISVKENRSLSNLIETILTNYIKNY